MRKNQAQQKSSHKGLSSDLASILGFLRVKIPEPAAVSIDEFAVELYFHNYHRTELSCLMTAEHIERGFMCIGEISNMPEMSEMKRLIDHIFIFAFCNIVVGDGSERAGIFIRNQGGYTTLPRAFLERLTRIDEKTVDQYPEIQEFLMNPSTTEFSNAFYVKLNELISQIEDPGMIYLLKHFLHNEVEEKETLKAMQTSDNKETTTLFRCDKLKLPFNESNGPTIAHRPQQYHEFRTTRNIPYIVSHKPGPRPRHIPSLTSVTVPTNALAAAMDPSSSAYAYSLRSELYYVSTSLELKELSPHMSQITCIAFSPCGKFLLSSCVTGDIRVDNLETGESRMYEPIKGVATACTFGESMFAVGTMDGLIHFYEITRERVQRRFAYHTATVTFMSIHPNCEFLASVAMDGTIRVFSISLGDCVRVWKAPCKVPLSCRFSHDGRMLVVACNDGKLQILDVGSTEVIRSMSIEAYVIDAVFSPNDQMIAIVDKTGGFSLWDAKDLAGDSLTVLRIGKLKPIVLSYLVRDEVRVLGCATTNKYFDESGLSF